MAITTYVELQAAAANWLVRADLTTRIPEFIALAEARLNRTLRARLAEVEVSLSSTPGARIVLLDNMDDAALRQAVAITAGRAVLEASGGVKLERVRAIAETGVDFISTSQITAAAPPLDLGLDISIRTRRP